MEITDGKPKKPRFYQRTHPKHIIKTQPEKYQGNLAKVIQKGNACWKHRSIAVEEIFGMLAIKPGGNWPRCHLGLAIPAMCCLNLGPIHWNVDPIGSKSGSTWI